MNAVRGRVHRGCTAARPACSLLALATVLLPTALSAATFRYASSSNRIYVEGGGSATLSDIKAALPKAPLDLVDPENRIWLLRTNLFVEDGSVLVLHGAAAGGDVDELRLKSDNAAAAGSFVQLTADTGSLDLDSTRVISWDAAAAGPDTEHATYGRAFMRVRSRLAADGVTPLESRMDVIDSEIGWLGYNASESYGLVWKVLGAAPGLYDRVQVRGNIIGSTIHHNYFGVYTYGHQDGLWRDNVVAYNAKYGFDPHDDSDNLVIENNDVHDNGNHGIIASQRCDHLVIRGNRSWNNVGNGIMLHRSSNDALVENNQSYGNTDSGLAIFASSRTQVRDNTFLDNGSAGIRFSVGGADNLVENNTIGRSGKYGLYFYRGSDAPEPGDDGRPRRNVLTGNRIHDSVSDGIKLSGSQDIRFNGNSFENNGGKLRFVSSTGIEFSGNTLPDDAAVALLDETGPASIAFSQQPRINLAQEGDAVARFTDAQGAVFDPTESVGTSISNGPSSLALTEALTGGSTTVYTRALWAYTSHAGVTVTPEAWNTGTAGTARRFTVHTPGADIRVAFVVGDLVPGARYGVRGETNLGWFTASSGGRISFEETLRGTGATVYTVTPQ